MSRRPVTLQINLAPTDLPTAHHTLPHQLRCWGGQVDEILLVLDLHRSRGRYSHAWRERLPGMRALIAETCRTQPKARAVEVDYSQPATASVAREFFAGRRVPWKDRQGAPFYAYLFGLQRSAYDLVLHMDSDMLYGGGSPTWIDEAIALMEADPHVMACNPLPGPPRADGTLRSQQLVPYRLASPAFSSRAISTRLFLLDRRRFMAQVGRLRLHTPGLRNSLKALVDGHPVVEPLEVSLSRAMASHGGLRVDFLGSGAGMWAVHPPYRNRAFFERLPSLVTEIEGGRIPEGQRGFHDLNQSMVDWSGASSTLAGKVRRHLAMAAGRVRFAGGRADG